MSNEHLKRQQEYDIMIKESKYSTNKPESKEGSWYLDYCKEYERTCKEVGGKNDRAGSN